MSLFVQSILTKLPTNFVSNREFCILIDENSRPPGFTPDTADEWVFSRSGIRTRPWFDLNRLGQGPASLNEEASLGSDLLQSSFTPDQWKKIDVIITVRSSPYHAIPSLSQRYLAKLNQSFSTPEKTLFTLDLFQPSTGFLAALKTARHLPFDNILIVVSEWLSPILNKEDPGTAMLFGDAIAAVVLTKEKSPETLFQVHGETFEAKVDDAHVLSGDGSPDSFRMKGPELFRKVVPEFKRSSLALLNTLSLQTSDIDYYLPHQANLRIIERAANGLSFRPEQVLTNIERVGNLSSASMLVALEEKMKTLKTGSKILLNACGAGLTSAAAVFEKCEGETK